MYELSILIILTHTKSMVYIFLLCVLGAKKCICSIQTESYSTQFLLNFLVNKYLTYLLVFFFCCSIITFRSSITITNASTESSSLHAIGNNSIIKLFPYPVGNIEITSLPSCTKQFNASSCLSFKVVMLQINSLLYISNIFLEILLFPVV